MLVAECNSRDACLLVDFLLSVRYTTHMRLCVKCQTPIEEKRLIALPDTRTCVACSETKKLVGHMTWEHKTAPTFNLVTPEQHETLQRHSRKGVHAQLPMSSKGPSTLGVTSLKPQVEVPPQDWHEDLSTIPAARCHPDRPKATLDGKCVECAVRWYKLRLK